MKIAVSIPDSVYASAEKLAARRGISRSQLYAEALAALLERQREDLITSRLNEIYGAEGESSKLDPDSSLLQIRSISKEKW